MKFQAYISSQVLLLEMGHWTASELITLKAFDINFAFGLSSDDNFLKSKTNKQGLRGHT